MTSLSAQPWLFTSSRVIQPVKVPAPVIAIFLPLRSATVLIGPPAFTLMTISTGAPDKGAMPFIGAPLTIIAMSVPPSSPMSIAPAVMPWIRRGPPPNAEDSMVRPCFSKMPVCIPTSSSV